MPKSNRIAKSTPDLIDIIDYYKNEAFINRESQIIDIYNIECSNLYGLTEDEKTDKIYYFYQFLKTYSDDIKIISMNFPTTTISQQNFLRYKIKSCNKAEHIPFLTQQLLELEYIAEHNNDLEFYLMIFCKNSADYSNAKKELQYLSNSYFSLHTLDIQKKENILFKLANQNCKIF